jgi:hypothetical protein
MGLYKQQIQVQGKPISIEKMKNIQYEIEFEGCTSLFLEPLGV